MIQDKIKLQYNLLTSREKEIIDTINSNINTIDNYSINNIAKLTYSSTSSISRLVYKLNMSYEEFKYFLVANKQSNPINVHSFDNNLLEAARMIKLTNRIFIAAVGQSRFLAKYLQDILFKLGMTVNIIAESDSVNTCASIVTSNDLIIFISSSGNTQTLVTLQEKVSLKKARSIIITANLNSTIAKNTNLCLQAESQIISTPEYSFALQANLLKIIDDLILTYLNE